MIAAENVSITSRCLCSTDYMLLISEFEIQILNQLIFGEMDFMEISVILVSHSHEFVIVKLKWKCFRNEEIFERVWNVPRKIRKWMFLPFLRELLRGEEEQSLEIVVLFVLLCFEKAIKPFLRDFFHLSPFFAAIPNAQLVKMIMLKNSRAGVDMWEREKGSKSIFPEFMFFFMANSRRHESNFSRLISNSVHFSRSNFHFSCLFVRHSHSRVMKILRKKEMYGQIQRPTARPERKPNEKFKFTLEEMRS